MSVFECLYSNSYNMINTFSNHLKMYLLCLFVHFFCAAERPTALELVVNDKYSIYPSEFVRWREAVNSCTRKSTNTDKHCDTIKMSEKHLIDSELTWRQKIVKSYLKDFTEIKKMWIEPENLNYISSESESSNEFLKANNHMLLNAVDYNDNHKPSDDITENKINVQPSKAENFHKVTPIINCVNDRMYIVRWLKKLLNKLKSDPYLQQNFIGFTYGNEFLENLEKTSASVNFDLESMDELISIAILNATSNYNAYDFSNAWFNSIFSTYILMLLGGIIFIVVMYVFYKIKMHPIYIIIILIVGSVIWHGYKMYLEEVAHRHAMLSSIPSSICEVASNGESGIFYYIKEYARYSFYKEHCKKYHLSVMVNPLSEINVLTVLVNFSSSLFCQLFYPCAKAINFFIKEAFYDMSFLQGIITLTLLIFLLLLYFRYKINFPFWLGSFEPMSVPTGSRVEDLPFPKRKSTLEVLRNLCDSPNFKDDDNISVKSTDCNSSIDTGEKMCLKQSKTLPFVFSKQKTFTKNIPKKILKFCRMCNKILLTNLDFTGNEQTENFVLTDDTKQDDLLSDNSECQYCSVDLQTVLCENGIFELQNISLKIVLEPCVHLKYICCDCTKSLQFIVSGDN